MRIVAGGAKGVRLKTKAPGVRPTSSRVRNALFSVLGPSGVEGDRVLDLYAGTGALGIEALSRGAAFARLVERDRRQCQAIRESLKAARLEDRAGVSCMTVMKYLRATDETFDVVVADPPYDAHDTGEMLAALVERGVVKARGTVVLEHSSRAQAPERPGLLLQSSRRYGDSALSFYTLGPEAEQEKETPLKS